MVLWGLQSIRHYYFLFPNNLSTALPNYNWETSALLYSQAKTSEKVFVLRKNAIRWKDIISLCARLLLIKNDFEIIRYACCISMSSIFCYFMVYKTDFVKPWAQYRKVYSINKSIRSIGNFSPIPKCDTETRNSLMLTDISISAYHYQRVSIFNR